MALFIIRSFIGGFMKKILLILLTFLFSTNLYADLKLYAVKYGQSKFNSKYIYYKDKQNKMLPFSWLFYAIKNDNKIILIDCGFTAKRYVKMFKIKYTDPLVLLSKIGIKSADVTDLIITHNHFDHAGNILKFPNAKIYVQKNEWVKISKRLRLNEKRRIIKNIVLFSNNYSLSENIKIYKIGSHTAGSSIVVINYKNRKIMLTGDEVYYQDNIVKQIPSGSAVYKRNKIFLEKIKGHKYIFLTFHDPAIIPGKNSVIKIQIENYPELVNKELAQMPY